MVYELSETDRVAMVCSVLQPCIAAMFILIEQDQHIEPIPDFCHLCQFSGMNMENATVTCCKSCSSCFPCVHVESLHFREEPKKIGIPP